MHIIKLKEQIVPEDTKLSERVLLHSLDVGQVRNAEEQQGPVFL